MYPMVGWAELLTLMWAERFTQKQDEQCITIANRFGLWTEAPFVNAAGFASAFEKKCRSKAAERGAAFSLEPTSLKSESYKTNDSTNVLGVLTITEVHRFPKS